MKLNREIFILFSIIHILSISFSSVYSYNLESFTYEYEDDVRITRNIFNGSNVKCKEDNSIEFFYYISSDDNFDKVREFYPEFSKHQKMSMYKGKDGDTSGLMIVLPGENVLDMVQTPVESHFTVDIKIKEAASDVVNKISMKTRENDQDIIDCLNKLNMPNKKNEEGDKSVGKTADKPADKAADKPADKPAYKAADKPADRPADKAADKPADKPANKANKPADKPANKANKPADKPKRGIIK